MTTSNDEEQGLLDRRFMLQALALGWRQQGLTSPNPAVGSVVVQTIDGAPVIAGLGATQQGGRPHSEPMALVMAGDAARGATLYVSLEPCCHQGRSGPCSDAIIAAGVARVVSGIEDIDPRVAGQGHEHMRAAGLRVDVGVCADEAYRAHRGHILRITQRRPLVTLKLARTKDGFASRAGERLLITGSVANGQVHLLRAHSDAILVGAETVIADDPQLTVRLPSMEGRSPIRVILDSNLRIPLASRIVSTAMQVPTWVVTTKDAPLAHEEALVGAGVVVIRVEAGLDKRVSLPAALVALAERGISRVFSESGPSLAEALARAGLIDEVVILTGPHALGGEDNHISGVQAIGPALAALLADPEQFRLLHTGYWGSDSFKKFERLF